MSIGVIGAILGMKEEIYTCVGTYLHVFTDSHISAYLHIYIYICIHRVAVCGVWGLGDLRDFCKTPTPRIRIAPL